MIKNNAKILKPFFTTKDVGKGTGMGLASVVETLRTHNGALEVDSVVGKGTTFTIIYLLNHGMKNLLMKNLFHAE